MQVSVKRLFSGKAIGVIKTSRISRQTAESISALPPHAAHCPASRTSVCVAANLLPRELGHCSANWCHWPTKFPRRAEFPEYQSGRPGRAGPLHSPDERDLHKRRLRRRPQVECDGGPARVGQRRKPVPQESVGTTSNPAWHIVRRPHESSPCRSASFRHATWWSFKINGQRFSRRCGLGGVETIVEVRDGAYVDTLPPFGNEYSGAGERAGTYSVTVQRLGYRVWRNDGRRVREDECHVIPVRVNARLQTP